MGRISDNDYLLIGTKKKKFTSDAMLFVIEILFAK